MRILFTGGSGKAGKHVMPWLKTNGGYEALNFDLKPENPKLATLVSPNSEIIVVTLVTCIISKRSRFFFFFFFFPKRRRSRGHVHNRTLRLGGEFPRFVVLKF